MSFESYKKQSNGLESPALNADSITPSDSVDLSEQTRAIYVGVSGDLKVTMVGGNTVTFVGVAAGIPLPIQAVRIFATLTTATDIIGLR